MKVYAKKGLVVLLMGLLFSGLGFAQQALTVGPNYTFNPNNGLISLDLSNPTNNPNLNPLIYLPGNVQTFLYTSSNPNPIQNISINLGSANNADSQINNLSFGILLQEVIGGSAALRGASLSSPLTLSINSTTPLSVSTQTALSNQFSQSINGFAQGQYNITYSANQVPYAETQYTLNQSGSISGPSPLTASESKNLLQSNGIPVLSSSTNSALIPKGAAAPTPVVRSAINTIQRNLMILKTGGTEQMPVEFKRSPSAATFNPGNTPSPIPTALKPNHLPD